MTTIDPREADEKVDWRSAWPVALIHVLALVGLVIIGPTTKALVLGAIYFAVRGFCITGGYHRYFSHRSYRTNRFVAFLLAFGGSAAAQKGPLWWASHHRRHHRTSDTPEDYHTPRKGFWFSHMGWIFTEKSRRTEVERIPDLVKYPELRFVERFDWIAPWAFGVASFLIAGLPGLFVGFFASTVLLWHTTFTVNSLAHVWGRRRYATDDTSRNNLVVALMTGGEGWHNNHHHYPASCRQGFYWWEIDPTYYVLRVMSWCGLVRDLRRPSAEVRHANRVADGAFDRGFYRNALDRAAAVVAASGLDADDERDISDALDRANQAGRDALRRRDLPTARTSAV